MYVEVDLEAEPPTVVLAEADDCTRFHLAVHGGGDAGVVDRVLRAEAVGTLDGDGEALVQVGAVRAMAEGGVGPGWAERFGDMLDYARSKGWLSDDGGSIRAHVERH